MIHWVKQFSLGALFQTFLDFIMLSRNLSKFQQLLPYTHLCESIIQAIFSVVWFCNLCLVLETSPTYGNNLKVIFISENNYTCSILLAEAV